MVTEALEAAEKLAKEGVSASVVNMHTIKPLDESACWKWQKNAARSLQPKNTQSSADLAQSVAETLAGKSAASFIRVGIQDKFGKSGKPSELFCEYGLTGSNIADQCKKAIAQKK